MDKTLYTLFLISSQLSTNNSILLALADKEGSLTKAERKQFSDEIAGQSEILDMLSKEKED